MVVMFVLSDMAGIAVYGDVYCPYDKAGLDLTGVFLVFDECWEARD